MPSDLVSADSQYYRTWIRNRKPDITTDIQCNYNYIHSEHMLKEPFDLSIVSLIIKPSNCTNPSGMGHCSWLFSWPKLLHRQTAHVVSHYLLGLNISLGGTYKYFFFFFFTGAGQLVLVRLRYCCSCQKQWNVECIYNAWPLCQFSCYIYSTKWRWMNAP